MIISSRRCWRKRSRWPQPGSTSCSRSRRILTERRGIRTGLGRTIRTCRSWRLSCRAERKLDTSAQEIQESGERPERDRAIRYQRFAVVLPDERAEVAVARFEPEKIIAHAVCREAELVGRFRELRSMQFQHLQYAGVNGRDVDDEGRLSKVVKQVIKKRARFVRRVRGSRLGQRAVQGAV